ncbi:MAG: hypothetical protein KDE27_03170, partial [Planctomycetes bacterium]|nr:hypothetical protein [Planctomycetota bacterium]
MAAQRHVVPLTVGATIVAAAAVTTAFLALRPSDRQPPTVPDRPAPSAAEVDAAATAIAALVAEAGALA